MNFDWQIAGHKKQLEFLENAMERGKLAHAYLFSGPQGVGKRLVALKMARLLLNEESQGRFNPDLLEVDGRAGVGIEQIRQLIYKLSLKPYAAPYKVAVIDFAENLTDEAQNALLKTIEEPKPYTVIILITSSPDRLLKTIVSRAQKINFGSVNFDDYQDLLPKKLSPEQKNLIKTFAWQKPGLALKIASDEEFLVVLAKLNGQLSTFLSSDTSQRLLLINELSEIETEELGQTFDFWLNELESQLLHNPDGKTANLIKQLIKARSLLDQSINTKLLLTNLMLNAYV
ncbi:MAG: AAA family ATPase [Candidatus Doudnabacteria bacterium]|nr:AAA family ATPase [Candidatus Doudnabacteria bacterium]